MRASLRNSINGFLKHFDLLLQSTEDEWEKNAFVALYKCRLTSAPKPGPHPVEAIVFSKDRAFQLHALLLSYSELVSGPAPLHILYHSSTREHQKAYEEVLEIFSGLYSFVRQSSPHSFRDDLIGLLDQVTAPKIFFLVDDILFIEPFSMNDFSSFDTDRFVPSLRMGLNLERSYTVQKEQKQPEELTPGGGQHEDKMFWRWAQGEIGWGYPLSVDGHLFSTQEITAMTKLISFSAPNQYEDQLQKFRRIFLIRTGVCYKKSRIVNIPCNKVQTINKNICGNIHQDYLLEQWRKGCQMNYRSLYGFFNTSAHQEIHFEVIRRT